MEYIVKREYNNGNQDILEIYHPTNKIKETWTSSHIEQIVKLNEETNEEYVEEIPRTETREFLYNSSEEKPLVIAKSRKDDYAVSDELISYEEDEDKE